MIGIGDEQYEDGTRSLATNLQALLGKLLLRELLHQGIVIIWFFDVLVLLLEDHLDVARAGHVCINATMGAVSATPAMLGTLNLNELNAEVVSIKILEIGIGLGIP